MLIISIKDTTNIGVIQKGRAFKKANFFFPPPLLLMSRFVTFYAFSWLLVLATNLYLSALGPILYLLARAPNSYLLVLAANLCWATLASNLYLVALAQICIYQPWPPICGPGTDLLLL